MSGMGSVCKSMPEQSLIHEQEVQANMRSLQQPRGQPSQPGKYAFGLKCYRRRPQPRPLFLVRDGVFSQPLFDKIKNTPMTCIIFFGQISSLCSTIVVIRLILKSFHVLQRLISRWLNFGQGSFDLVLSQK
jgi:hypothetical protein